MLETDIILVSALAIASALGVLGLLGLIAIFLRRVVPTNEVHIVQSAKETTSYGKDTTHGNTYYEWPSWVPGLGIDRVTLPTSVFDLDLESYEAYDKGRLPFVVDVKAFFRITDSNTAAQRVASFKELHQHLKAIVQGSIRVILASNDIEVILQGRSTFGEQFTKEVADQLLNWGVSTVKNIELMDIRDSRDSHVIRNIMEKKKSHIEMESRIEVAKNKRNAQIAEIDANKVIDLEKQDAAQQVNSRQIETYRKVETERQVMNQALKEAENMTKKKEMEILRTEQLKQAEINKEVAIVEANQNREIIETNANAQQVKVILEAQGELESQRRKAEAIYLLGKSSADAEKAMQLAPVEAQITLAKEIGENESYQNYLVTIRKVEAGQAVGIAQAQALASADVKIIANAGNPVAGIENVRDLFSSKGGTELGAMLEGLAQSEVGQKIVKKFT